MVMMACYVAIPYRNRLYQVSSMYVNLRDGTWRLKTMQWKSMDSSFHGEYDLAKCRPWDDAASWWMEWTGPLTSSQNTTRIRLPAFVDGFNTSKAMILLVTGVKMFSCLFVIRHWDASSWFVCEPAAWSEVVGIECKGCEKVSRCQRHLDMTKKTQ